MEHPATTTCTTREEEHSASDSDWRPTLPPELILLIVEAVAPANPKLIIPPSHPTAQTLLALSKTCRLTRGPASRLLRERCMCIESADRLARVVSCLEATDDTCTPSRDTTSSTGDGSAAGTTMMCELPPIAPLKDMTSLYLAPFVESLDEDRAVELTRKLLGSGLALRRLIIRMPRDGGTMEDDFERGIAVEFATDHLVDCFVRNRLEELVCLSGGSEFGRLYSLPRLLLDVSDFQRLVLFEAPLWEGLMWCALTEPPRLRSVVLACPVGAGPNSGGINVKRALMRFLPRERWRADFRFKITLVDVAYEMEGLVDTRGWEEIDPEGRVTVRKVEVPLSFYGDEDRAGAVTEWVRRAALDGSIWEWEGEPF